MAAAASTSSSCGPDPSSVAHRRRLADVEGGGGGRRRGVRALFSVRRSYNSSSSSKRASSSMVDQAWVRNAVASLLGLALVIGLLSSHRAGAGRLVRRVDVVRVDGEALGWREENLTALARRSSPDTPPVSACRR